MARVYQKWPYFEEFTFSKLSFWVSMFVFRGCINGVFSPLEIAKHKLVTGGLLPYLWAYGLESHL